MKYSRFEELPVWKRSADLAAHMFRWSAQSSLRGKGDLAKQLQRATLSISNNIAEGFERGTTSELLAFLYIARGSAGEVRSMLCVMQRMEEFSDLQGEIVDLASECELISRQLRAWAGNLQNSGIKGQRHLNDRSRQKYDSEQQKTEARRRRADFQRELEQRLKTQAAERDRRNKDQAGSAGAQAELET